MKILSQRDPAWAETKIGATTLTLGRWGCTTTAVSMASDYFNCYKSPLELAKNVHNYNEEGEILWWNLKFDNMQFVKRMKGTTADLMPKIKEILKDPDRVAVVEVNNKSHWVLAYSTRWFSNDLAVADPWYGKVVPVLKLYKNLTGLAVFRRSSKKIEREVITAVPTITAKYIKSSDKPEIYYYNGKKKFLFPNWFTFVELGGDMAKVQTVMQYQIDEIDSGRNITNVKP